MQINSREYFHKPVMLQEAIEHLNIRPKGVYIDCTLGGGGHTEAILQKNDTVKVFAFDQDSDAVSHAAGRLAQYSNRLVIINDNFAQVRTKLALNLISEIDGVLFDLGVSSFQIDNAEKGFSFSQDGALDMRMNSANLLTAKEIVNEFSFEKITEIIRDYGEEFEAARIARNIERSRKDKVIETTAQLSEIIEKSIRGNKIKAKARVFQAFRIYINSELFALEKALNEITSILKPDGRIVVISYHSLEDRIVKQFFNISEKECICPPKTLKCVCNKKRTLEIITKKPLLPSEKEVSENKRARSAKMRVAKRVGA